MAATMEEPAITPSQRGERLGKVYYDQRWRLWALRILVVAVVVLILIAEPVWRSVSLIHKSIQFSGLALLIAAMLGRLWATLYIGGRKNISLMTSGPYSITRNPLYVFSTMGSIGAGLMFGSLLLAGLLGLGVGIVLYATARGEAVLLRRHFGSAYRHYASRVPLFWPRPSLYQDAISPTFNPLTLKRALGDAVLFVLVIPVAGLIDLLRDTGMPSLFVIP